jgi:hypothetical protein
MHREQAKIKGFLVRVRKTLAPLLLQSAHSFRAEFP